ncbi:hypothetical protein J437_LFUL012482 [Ladona fulva]|uniref:Uncharacterized protein n=1 Tax=Ladona fulva TaxID=123851 RepID=A0A8K0P406_LADFU|nr:hypothetical protein J437_LFUL012482 [Ladona fulva]
MGEELLINFNDSLKMQSFDGQKADASYDPGKEIKCLPDLSSFLRGSTILDSKVTSNIQEKSILDKEYDELIPQLSSPIKANLQSSNDESSNLIGLSPYGCVKVNRTNTIESDLIVECNPTNLMSPFGCPVKVRSKDVTPGSNMQNLVPTGQLLPVQDEPKSCITVDVFDVEVLEKKLDIKHSNVSNDLVQDESKSRLALPSIPSIGSGESQYSSCGVINLGFLEAKSPAKQVDLSQSPNNSVFEEAQAIAEELSRMAKCEKGIESETSSIVSNSSDLDDIELTDMKLIGNDLDELLDIYAIENNDNLVEEESFRKMRINTPKMVLKYSSEAVPMGQAQTNSSSSSLSTSPLPLSTERLNHMRLKGSEAVGASLKLAPLKKNTCLTAVPGRSGPLKALVPLSQIVKNSVSPVGVVPAKPRSMKLTETSPDFIRPVKASAGILSSTPIINKPHSSTKLLPLVKKGLSGNIKGANNLKSNHDATLTPSGQRASSIGRTQGAGKHTSIARPVATAVNRKGSIPSPSMGKRYSNNTPNIKTPVARSSSTGHLPLTPSMKKVNGAASTQAFQSPLRRSNSLSAKLTVGSPSRTMKMPSINSPGKSGTSLDKLISKFRRVSVSRGMKENVSPGKY